MHNKIRLTAEKFIKNSKDKEITVISHFDTDGITSAAIMIKSLKKLDKKFSIKITKGLDKQFIYNLAEKEKNKIIFFLDLASGSLDYIKNSGLNSNDIFIIDHHEIIQEIPKNVDVINPQLYDGAKISTAGLVYLFCKEILSDTTHIKECAKLAILGMIGDTFEKNMDKAYSEILKEGEVIKKRGLLLYPSTRPINRVLEYNSNPYIPGVTGDIEGTKELLREVNLESGNNNYKTLLEINEEEMSRLITAIVLKIPGKNREEIIGDIFLIKLYNQLEDARELSARINACSRLGDSGTALQLCIETTNANKKAEKLHAKYRRHIISGLEFARKTKKIEGKGYTIINARNGIKDTIIGTIASILSHSLNYEEGTIITTMALSECGENIKISARNVGKNGRNVRDVLNTVITKIGGEVGGHEFAAGGLIHHSKEEEFIDSLKKSLEIEVIKI